MLAFDLGVSLVDIQYANTSDLTTIGKIMLAAPAGRIAGVKLFGYSFNPTFDPENFLGPSTWAAVGIWLADKFVDGPEMNALTKLIGPLLAFSLGKVFDPAPVDAGSFAGNAGNFGSQQLTYGQMAGF